MVNPINPPDGWVVTAGTWGVDFQRDTTTTLTGGTSLKVVGTSANTQTLQGPWIPLDSSGANYCVSAWVQATNNTSLFTLRLELYGSDQATLLNTVYLYNNQAAPTASVWLMPSKECVGTNWARLVLTRASGQTASIYIDRVEIKKLVPRWSMRKSGGAQVLPVGGSLFASFNVVDFSDTVTASGTTVTVYRAGIYVLCFRALISGMAAASPLTVTFRVDDPLAGSVWEFCSGTYVADGAGFLMITHTALYHHPGTLGGGSPIKVQLTDTGAGGGTLSGSFSALGGSLFSNEVNAYTNFMGTWIGVG